MSEWRIRPVDFHNVCLKSIDSGADVQRMEIVDLVWALNLQGENFDCPLSVGGGHICFSAFVWQPTGWQPTDY